MYKKGMNEGGRMIWIIIFLIVVVTIMTKWISNRLIQKHQFIMARLVVTLMVLIQIILVYYLVKLIVSDIVKLLNIFYNQ